MPGLDAGDGYSIFLCSPRHKCGDELFDNSGEVEAST